MQAGRPAETNDHTAEIAALIETLHQANQRLEELTAGQIDAVSDREGRTFLLRRAQEKLRHGNASRQAAILNALPTCIALIDAQGEILSTNDAWSQCHGRNIPLGPGHTVGRNYLRSCEGVAEHLRDECERMRAGIGDVLAGRSSSFAIEYIRQSDADGPCDYLATVTPLVPGQTSGAVVMHENVTADRRIKARLSSSEAMFRQMAESIGDVFFLRSLDGSRMWYVSPAFETIWGRSCASLYADPSSWSMAVHPDDRDVVEEIETRGLLTGSYEVEYRIVLPDGAFRRIHSRGYPVHDESGNIIRLAGVAKDVTELHETGLALQRTVADLSQSNRDLRDFAHVASHDLQEPLRMILMYVDRLLGVPAVSDDARARGYAERSIHWANRMRTLISSLLTLSEISSMAKAFVPIDLQQLLREVVDDLETTIERTGAHIDIGAMPVIEGDETGLRQAFQNLIANALKFSKEGKSPVVRVRAYRQPDSADDGPWTIAVEDDGIGFEQKYAARIFTVFQRLHDQKKYEGSGIGLSIVRRVVQRHHGSIVAIGGSGRGARFELTLPQYQPRLPGDPQVHGATAELAAPARPMSD